VPPRRNQPPEPPTAMDVLDPAPREQRPPVPRARPRRPPPGEREKGVRHDLALLPEELRKGGIAAGLTGLARDLDQGFVTGRDAAGHVREIRQGLMVLREMAPGERNGDQTDDLRARRERRLTAGE
jgi:hypothetical protein